MTKMAAVLAAKKPVIPLRNTGFVRLEHEWFRHTGRNGSPGGTIGSDLTARELEVLSLIASGHSTKKLAQQLGITPRTAACHRSRVLLKLDAHNAADLTRAAIRMGLVDPSK
jgi:DNA-binding CsgD family transcriptional regulator